MVQGSHAALAIKRRPNARCPEAPTPKVWAVTRWRRPEPSRYLEAGLLCLRGKRPKRSPLPISIGTPTHDFQESGSPGQEQKIQFEVFRSPSFDSISIFEGKEWLGADGEQSGPSWVENPR